MRPSFETSGCDAVKFAGLFKISLEFFPKPIDDQSLGKK
jgi:hypothetical protein